MVLGLEVSGSFFLWLVWFLDLFGMIVVLGGLCFIIEFFLLGNFLNFLIVFIEE